MEPNRQKTDADNIPNKRYEHPEGIVDTKENINKHNSLMKENKDGLNKEEIKLKRNSQRSQNKSYETTDTELLSKVTAEDLKTLCEQLSIFNTRIQSAKQSIRLRYDLPNELQERLEVEAEELESSCREWQDTRNQLEIIQNQRAALAKEKLSIDTKLEKLKSDMANELEIIVSVYDSQMMQRWEVVKNDNNIQDVENFLHDVKGKLQAMKNLQVLSSNKLADLKNKEKKNHNSKKEKKKKNKETNSNHISENLNPLNAATFSESSLPLLPDTDSEELMGDMQNVLFSFVCDQVLGLPSLTPAVADID